MEKLLAPSRSTFLLEAPLEVLHEESLEWLDEIEFCKDEAAFFYSLILKRAKELPLLKTKQAKNVESHLIYFSAERMDDMKIEISSHEKFLSRIIDRPDLDEQLYRKRHKEISQKFHEFMQEFRQMKRKIFELVKIRSKK